MLAVTMDEKGGHADLICETPPRTNAKRLGVAILASLGKQRKVQSVPKRLWKHVEIWLDAEGIHRLFFTRSNSLLPDAIEALDELRHKTKIDIWILDPTNGQWTADAAVEVTKWEPAGFEIRQKEIRELRIQLSDRGRLERSTKIARLGTTESLGEWPSHILAASPLGFLTACERAIDSKSILGEIKREFHATLKMFSETPYDDGLMGYNAGSCRRILGRVRFALSSARTEQRAYIRMKAAQVHAFRESYYLRHPDITTCLRAASPHPGLHMLKAFSEPNDAALGLAAFRTGLSLNDLVKIKGLYGKYEFGGLPFSVPSDCQSIIRAAEFDYDQHRRYRADSSDPLPLFYFDGLVRSARPYFSLFKDLVRIEERCKFRAFNRDWPAQWGFRMIPMRRP